MKWCLIIKGLLAAGLAALCVCSGGGADVGNPLTGIVSQTDSTKLPAAGTRIVLSWQDSDPGADVPGNEFRWALPSGEDIGILGVAHSFDTTFTDGDGKFLFENMLPGNYTLYAVYNGLCALANVRKNADEPADIVLRLAEPGMVTIRMYEPVDTAAALHFIGARVAGTTLFAAADVHGEMKLTDVPEADDIAVLLYRSDSVAVRYSPVRVRSGGLAQLFALPTLPPTFWTAHNCGPRHELDRPFVLETCIPLVNNECGAQLDFGKPYTLRIRFSIEMDALSTTAAIHPLLDDSTTALLNLWWEGSNVVYITLGNNNGADSTVMLSQTSVQQGKQYGVTIDTTAQTSRGVSFGYRERISFVPKP